MKQVRMTFPARPQSSAHPPAQSSLTRHFPHKTGNWSPHPRPRRLLSDTSGIAKPHAAMKCEKLGEPRAVRPRGTGLSQEPAA